jgi:uncharacterized membrane protein
MTPAREALRRTATSVAVGCLVPGALFYATYLTIGVWPAVGVALAWTYGALLVRRVTGRRVSGLLVVATGVLTLRAVVAVVAGSPFLYFLQPVISDFVVGALFLASLLTARPVVARLAPDFYPMCETVAARPGVRRLFARLTALWGAVFIVKGSVFLWLLLSQTLDTYVLVRSISMPPTNASVIAATALIAVVVARREGLIRSRSSVLVAA